MTAGELHDALARLGADLMARALAAWSAARSSSRRSRQGVTYAAKIDKAETRIDWAKPWHEVHDHIRGLSPFPGAWCEMDEVPRQSPALDQRRRQRPARHGARRPADRRLRRGRRAHRRICRRPAAADEGAMNSCAARRSSARHAVG